MSTPPDAPAAHTPPIGPTEGWNLTRRGWTVLSSSLLVMGLLVLGLFVPVPYVSLGPGPTYDTLGDVEGVQVVSVNGTETFPTSGQLRMTTVSVQDDVSMFEAVARWVSGRYALAPREEYFKPGVTEEEVQEQNSKLFQDSQSNAEIAALRYLKYPMKVIAQSITSGAPADKVLVPGDRLLVVNGKPIAAAEDVRAALAGTTPGQAVAVTFQREGQEKSGTITLGKATDFGASDRPEGFMGLESGERPDVTFKTSITLADVGGPSAGLMFALAIVDRLTRGDLGDGAVIAGTGEITAQGKVDAIGGIPFKMISAHEAGATTFLVPADNCAEAKENAPDGLRLVKVENLEGAVRALDDLKAKRDVPSC
ncbi:YlbL family protein [Actinokineospora alba]|uniref:YlbL family protein n=1 Tax=Actinokineospora alba TaxID=504798 RepID=UPI001E470920|nr:S16 family serine protease [Actinokineospora alba]